MFFKILQFLKYSTAFIISAATFACVAFLNATAFPFEGEKEYYLYSTSSQAVVKSSLSILELPFLRGESVAISVGSETESSTALEEEELEKILKYYSATVLKTESFSDGTSYYCYSPKLKGGVVLDGMLINLHVAVRGERIVLGTPLIFGGY